LIKIIKTLPNFLNFIRWLENKKNSKVAFDTETTGLNPKENKILLLQFGDEQVQYVIDVARIATANDDNIKSLFKTINSLNIILVAHNAKFDYKMVKGNYGIEIENIMCTMLGAKLLTLGRKHMILTNLGVTLKRYLGVILDKSMQISFVGMTYGDSFTDEQLIYSGNDVKYLLPLLDKELKIISYRNLENVIVQEFNCIGVTGDMELNGALIDVDKWLALEKIALKDAKGFKEKLDTSLRPYIDTSGDLFNEVLINYNSPKQLLPVLTKALGFKIESTGAPVLEKLDNSITNLLLSYRKRTKLASTYGSEFLKKHLEKDGKLRSTFIQLGPGTGRYASKNPNLQNIPADPRYREPFIAPKGYKFISVDYSGQELRLLAHLSQDPAMLEALKTNKDLHAYSASLIYNIPYKDFFQLDEYGNIKYDASGEPIFIPEMKKTYRNNAKSLSFGLLYGMGPYKLSVKLEITLIEAKELMVKYFKAFPKVKVLMDKLVNDMMEKHYATSPLDGRKAFFTDLDWDDQSAVAHAKNQAKNLPFQAGGASCIKQSLIYIKEKINELKFDAQILFAVHDKQHCCV